MKLKATSKTSTSGVFVSSLVEGGQALASSMIDIGHRICSINKESTDGLTFDDVMMTLRTAGRPCTIEFRVEDKLMGSKSDQELDNTESQQEGNSFGIEIMADDEDESNLSFANMQEKHAAIAEKSQSISGCMKKFFGKNMQRRQKPSLTVCKRRRRLQST